MFFVDSTTAQKLKNRFLLMKHGKQEVRVKSQLEHFQSIEVVPQLIMVVL